MVYFPNTDEDRGAPGSRFTLAQLVRFSGRPAPQGRELIGKLVAWGHMAQTPDGLYYLVRLRRLRRGTGRPCAS